MNLRNDYNKLFSLNHILLPVFPFYGPLMDKFHQKIIRFYRRLAFKPLGLISTKAESERDALQNLIFQPMQGEDA